MAGPRDQYTKEMYGKFGYLAVWAPNVALKLGDVGIIKKHEFTFVTSLANLGIKFDVRHGSELANLEYQSAGAVSVEFQAAGDVPLQGSALANADARAVIRFSRANAVVFSAADTYIDLIEDQDQLGKEILAEHNAGQWEKDYAVVTELVTSPSATVFISDKKDAQLELKAEGNIDPATLSLASVNAGFSLGSFQGLQTRIIAAEGLTPLFKAKAVRMRWPSLGGKVFRSASRAELAFEELGDDDVS